MKIKLPFAGFLLAACLLFAACNYDVPLTERPTHKVDERLLGNWVTVDEDGKKELLMSVRRLDDSNYVVAMDGDVYRAFHSDFAGTAFLSVQNLQSGGDDRKYVYFVWRLSADGTQLSLKGVSTRVVPEETKGRAALQKLIQANLANPKLFGEELVFTPKKR